MKIVILSTIEGYEWGGTEEVWRQFAVLALKEGHEILLACDELVAGSSQVSRLIDAGLSISTRRKFGTGRLALLVNAVHHPHRDVQAFQPDILLINSGSPFDLMYSSRLKAFVDSLNCKKVFFCHFNSDRLEYNGTSHLQMLLSTIDHWVFVNERNRREFEVQALGHVDNSTIILNGCRETQTLPLPAPEGEAVLFASVARLEMRWKGQDILCGILRDEIWELRGVKVNLFGIGPDKSKIESLVNLYGIDDTLKTRGYSDSLEELWSRHHALLLPSRGEGTPLAALEAMMYGRPVIATDVGGVSEIIEDGVSGFIAEAPTERSFMRAMERAWSARERWPEIGESGHQAAVRLTRSDPAGQLLRTLEAVIGL